jgi:hypothetical protein
MTMTFGPRIGNMPYALFWGVVLLVWALAASGVIR